MRGAATNLTLGERYVKNEQPILSFFARVIPYMVKIGVAAILGSSEADLKDLPHVVRLGADPG